MKAEEEEELTKTEDEDFPTFSTSEEEDEDCDMEIKLRKMMDITSKSYNPLFAISCKDKDEVLTPDQRKVPTYFSVKDFKKHIPDITKQKKHRGGQNVESAPATLPTSVLAEKQSTSKTEVEDKKPAEISTENVRNYPIPGRRFLPHQLPVHRPRKEHPNVITLMGSVEGPLAALNKVRLSRSRIKVWTKNNIGIRGYCTANLEAFDKHWNLLLSNVNEKFQRKRHLKTPASLPETDELASFKTGQILTEFQSQSKSRSRKEQADNVRIKNIEKGIRTLRLADDFDSGTVTMFQNGLENFIPRKGEVEDLSCSKAKLRERRLVMLSKPIKDFHGNTIVAQSKHYEIVHRWVPQLMLFGDSVVVVETGAT